MQGQPVRRVCGVGRDQFGSEYSGILGTMPGGLTYGHDTPTSISLQLASLLRRRPRLSTTVFAVFLVLLILRLEWGWFRPRLGISLPSKSALDDEMLPLRVLRAEETYQKMLRSRKELIHRAGPEKDAVSA